MEEDIYHRMGIGGDGNRKYTNGPHEGVYGPDGKRINDPVNGGTYNYSPLETAGGLAHMWNDVIPYYKWGNNPNDPTTKLQRMRASYNGQIPNVPTGCGCD